MHIHMHMHMHMHMHCGSINYCCKSCMLKCKTITLVGGFLPFSSCTG